MSFNFFIIGLGQIGCSLALSLKKKRIANALFGKDLRKKSFYKEIVDEYVEELEDGVKKADIVILATPVLQIMKLIEKISPILKENQILLDTGSTKKEILMEMKKFPEKIMIGGHPMAGSVNKGKKALNENLFDGKPFFLFFPNENSRKGEDLVKKIIRGIGAIPYEIDADTHDFYVSLVSHLPYVISLTLYSVFLDFYSKDNRIEDFISSGFIGSTRLALTESKVGIDIIATNKFNINMQIERFIQEIKLLKMKIKKNEFSDFIIRVKKEIEKKRGKYENIRF